MGQIFFEIDPGAAEIIRRLEEAGFEAYAVGGSVRDALLSRPASDWDITTSATTDQMKEIFPRTFDTGIKHGTVSVRLSGKTYEVTTYRTDGVYEDHRHPSCVSFTASLYEDLARRDFTINAFAYHPLKGLVDSFDGLQDLHNGLIRAVGDASKRFEEDALRILRAIRFAAVLDFALEQKTYAALCEKAPLLVYVSKERIESELNKMLLSNHPQKAAMLFECGVSPYLASEMADITEGGQAEKYLQPLCKVPSKRSVRWTLFLRSLSEEQAASLMRTLRFDNDSYHTVLQLKRFLDEPLPKTAYEMRVFLSRLGSQLFPDFLTVSEALYGENPALVALYESQKTAPVSLSQLSVKGSDIISHGFSGKEVGQKLDEALQLVLKDPSLNQRDVLLSMILDRSKE